MAARLYSGRGFGQNGGAVNVVCNAVASAIFPVFAVVPRATVQWGLFGIAFVIYLIYCLRTGTIPYDSAAFRRGEDRFYFNAYIFWGALMAVIFFGAAIAFYFYPNATGPMIRDELPSNW